MLKWNAPLNVLNIHITKKYFLKKIYIKLHILNMLLNIQK